MACEGVLRLLLIGVDPVGERKHRRQRFVRLRTTGILRLDRVPGVFVMIVRRAFVRPVDRLVQMPEPRRVNTVVLRVGRCSEHEQEQEKE